MKDNHTPGPGYIEGSMNGVNTQIILRDKNHRLFKRAEIMCWPGQDKKEANDSALLYNAAYNSYDKHCGDRAVECAEGDLLGECLVLAKEIMRWWKKHERDCYGEEAPGIKIYRMIPPMVIRAKAILTKRKGEL